MRLETYDPLPTREQHRTNDSLLKTNRNSHLYRKISQTLSSHTASNEHNHRPTTADQNTHTNTGSSLKKAYFYRKNLNKSNLFHLSPDTTSKYSQQSFQKKKTIAHAPIFFEQTGNNQAIHNRLTVDFANISQLQRYRKGNLKNVTFGQFIARKKSKQGRVRKLNEAWSVEQTKKAKAHIDLEIQGRSRFVKAKETPHETPSPIKSIEQENNSPIQKSIKQEADPLPIQPQLTSLNNLQKIDIELYSKRMCHYLNRDEKTIINPATIEAVKSNELGLYIHSLRRSSPDKPSLSYQNRFLNKYRTSYNQERPQRISANLNVMRTSKQKKAKPTDELQGWNVIKDNEFVEEDIFN